MLTRELAIAEYESGQIIPDRLTQQRHAHYVALAKQCLDAYCNGIGRTRRALHETVHHIFAEELECPVRRIDAFCKLLDDKSEYDRDRRGIAAKLRKQVFRMATGRHPLVQQPDQLFDSFETQVKQDIARELGKSWQQIERELFADIIQFHRLAKFEGYASAAAFLSRYNIAQCQAVLYDAVNMTVWASDDFKSILRYAKLAGLMHAIQHQSDGSYLFRFDGPATVLRRSRRYGVALASFLPALLSCRNWKMQALIKHRRLNWQNYFRITSDDGLSTSSSEHELFDSALEEKFAVRWGNDSRDGWRLIREGEVLHVGQKTFVPDFVFEHESGCRVLMEIVGFWTPEYLSAKLETLQRFRGHEILLAVSDQIEWSEVDRGCDTSSVAPLDTIRYKTSIQPSEILERLNQRLGKQN